MAATEIPNFAVLLGPFIEKIPDAARPAFLAALERGAAQRYREWAEQAPDRAEGLLACAEREDEIGRRVDELLPADDEGRARIESAFPEARRAYYEVFAGLPLHEQWRIQASAERQGANAWRLLASEQDDAKVREDLLGCAALEVENAGFLQRIVERLEA